MEGKQQNLDPEIFPGFLLSEEHDTADMQAVGFKKQEGDEKEFLVFDDKARNAAFFEGSFFAEGDDRDGNVRVHVFPVGVGVMLVVLIHPPAITHANQQVAVQKSKEVVLFCGMKSLAVAGIVGNESDLSENEG